MASERDIRQFLAGRPAVAAGVGVPSAAGAEKRLRLNGPATGPHNRTASTTKRSRSKRTASTLAHAQSGNPTSVANFFRPCGATSTRSAAADSAAAAAFPAATHAPLPPNECAATAASPISSARAAEVSPLQTLPFCLQQLREGNVGVGCPTDTESSRDSGSGSGSGSGAGANPILTSFIAGYLGAGTAQGEGYMVMTADTARVGAFKAAVRGAVTEGACRNWLEVGPGAHGALTRLVLEASPHTTITAIEGNSMASKRVEHVLRQFGDNRWRVVPALTSSTEARAVMARLAESEIGCDAVLFELLGMIMSAEYVVDIMHDVHSSGLLQKPVRFLPRWGATFFTPVCVRAQRHLRTSLMLPRSQGVGVGVSPDGQWLHARRFPMQDAAAFHAADRSPVAGCLEFIDFSAPLDKQRVQERTTLFDHERAAAPASSAGSAASEVADTVVNGLALWIWAGFDCALRRGRVTQAAFPYGVDTEELRGAAGAVKVSVSSFPDEPDKGAYASSWRNVVMLFPQALLIPPGSSLRVTSLCDLSMPYRPVYAFRAELLSPNGAVTATASTRMDKMYHEFEFGDFVWSKKRDRTHS